ncbi:pyroglutamyl-peptidase I [Keratinibaculum paraultunense]|uniref:Pyrrolidone-carboxylate peptidase n=1 Tax=Keratinibaculum paraultunense TaxID=1278232 RepID=A0A4R3KW32_9FIRM|nr:pyroglutamyl-peptidase I [Keratinibaculum paraultunense]QQY79292.1 pyroglutamyl-peptidase I [Keratinibaculum paraultunense]TCS89425.1 pyroglutamyl-peptidase I [Keratinibaculum paraultunense]
MKILVTGFDPFGGESVNPAYEAVKRLDDNIAGAEIVKVEIPTVFGKSINKLDEAIEKENPDIVICVGQAGGRFDITVERVAINISDASIEDNEGNMPIDEPIFEDGESAYFSQLPIKAMVQKIREGGIPASVSNTAGTYVCNHIMYGLHYLIDKKYQNIKGGFIHVPFLPEQVIDKRATPSMNLNDIVKALTLAIEAVVENKEDIKMPEGKTH